MLFANLQLLQLPDVRVTLQLQISHLVLVFLVLMEPLVLLPLVFLRSKLDTETVKSYLLICPVCRTGVFLKLVCSCDTRSAPMEPLSADYAEAQVSDSARRADPFQPFLSPVLSVPSPARA